MTPVPRAGHDGHVHPVVAALNDVFAGVPHTMFCVKDPGGRYLAINQAFAERSGHSKASAVLGRRATDLFPADLAQSYEAQDARVLATGEALRNALELILRPDGSRGWYVTTKTCLRDEDGEVIGIAAVSYDLHAGDRLASHHVRLQVAIDMARTQFADQVKVGQLAEAAGMTTTQLDRALRRTIGLSPKQLLMRSRLDEAINRLEDSSLSLAVIAQECGYYDQSSFTRLFQRSVGMTPGAYRDQAKHRRAVRDCH